MELTIADDLWQAARITESELRQELAVMLFQRHKLTMAQASRLSELSQLQFQHVLASRQIPWHYDETDLAADLVTLQRLNRI